MDQYGVILIRELDLRGIPGVRGTLLRKFLRVIHKRRVIGGKLLREGEGTFLSRKGEIKTFPSKDRADVWAQENLKPRESPDAINIAGWRPVLLKPDKRILQKASS